MIMTTSTSIAIARAHQLQQLQLELAIESKFENCSYMYYSSAYILLSNVWLAKAVCDREQQHAICGRALSSNCLL